MTTNCKNCTSSLEGKFCSNCGQTANTHEIDFHSILHEIQHSLLHIDKGILYTTKELFIRPGDTIREYLDGKRVKHFKPFSYILILSTIYAYLSRLSQKSTFITDAIDGFNGAMAEGKSDSKIGIVKEALLWMSDHYAYTTLLLIPIFSFASYICFYKSKNNYFQHLILNSFVAGQRTALFLVILMFTFFVIDEGVNQSISTLKVYIGICLTFWSYFRFFDSIKPYKRVLLTILTYFIMMILIFLIIILVVIIQKNI